MNINDISNHTFTLTSDSLEIILVIHVLGQEVPGITCIYIYVYLYIVSYSYVSLGCL